MINFSEDNGVLDFHLVKIGEHTFVLEECKNFPEGLSNRKHLLDNEGMLFNFSSPSERSFHMRNCLIPLDILFIEKEKIKKIYHNCDPCKSNDCLKYSCDSADAVVELLGGTCKKNNINEGLIYRHF
jgi:uncharacterized membrane protein (UPF0127 family)